MFRRKLLNKIVNIFTIISLIMSNFFVNVFIVSAVSNTSSVIEENSLYPTKNSDRTYSLESEYYNSKNKPIFWGTSGIKVPVGTKIDYKHDARFRIFAKDNEDGDLTSKIVVTDNFTEDYNTKTGTYSITYSVTDSDGNTSKLVVPVEIRESTEIELEKLMYSLPSVDHLNSVGQTRGNNMDRQTIGIFVQAGGSFQIKKNSTGNITLRMERNDSVQETAVTLNKNNEWFTVQNAITSGDQTLYYDATPNLKTLYKETGQVTYTVKWDSTDARIKPLHYYHEGDGLEYQETFLKEWADDENSYAMVDGLSMMVLVPWQDHDHMFYKPYPGGKPYDSFEHFLTWWNDIMDEYDELIGLSYTPNAYYNQDVKTKYFVKANAHGAGAAYYNGSDHVGINSSSDWSMFQVGWGGLHEVGHGYQGNLNSGGLGMPLTEVGVNLNGYYIQDVAHKFIYNESWLGLAKNEANFNNLRLQGLGYQDNGTGNIGAAAMLYSLVNALDYFENFSQNATHGYKEANAYINQYFRKHYFETGEKLQTADAWCLALAEKYNVNFVLYFESWGVKVSDYVKEQLMSSDAELVYYMRDLVGDDATAKSIKPDSNVGIYDLVTTKELQGLLKTNLTENLNLEIKIDDLSQVLGKTIYIADGDNMVKKIKVDSANITINLPVGVYRIAVPKPDGVYDFDNLYVIVKKGGNNTYEIVYNKINSISFGNDVLIKSIGYYGASKVPFQIEIINNQMKFSYQGTTLNSGGTKAADIFSSLTLYDNLGNKVYEKSVHGARSELFTNLLTAEDNIDVALGYKLTILYRGNINEVIFYSTLTGEQLPSYVINSSTHERSYIVTEYGLIPEELIGDYPNGNISDEAYNNYKRLLDEYIDSYMDGKTEDELLDPFSPNKGSNVIKNAIQNLKESDKEKYEEKLKDISTGQAPVITSSENKTYYEFDLADGYTRTLDEVKAFITVTDKEDGNIYNNGTLTTKAKELGDTVEFSSDVNWNNIGTYHVTITATDSHNNLSTLVLEVHIVDTSSSKQIDISTLKLTVEGVDEGFIYTGSAITPKVTLTDKNGHDLTEGIDFEVIYSNNINAGTADIEIRAIQKTDNIYFNNYTGVIKLGFIIEKADPEALPATNYVVENEVSSVTDVVLPEGWEWKTIHTLKVGDNYITAIYLGDENHKEAEITVVITRKDKEIIPETPPTTPPADPKEDDMVSSGEPWGPENPNHGEDFTEDPALDVRPNDDGDGVAKDPNGEATETPKEEQPEQPKEEDKNKPTEPGEMVDTGLVNISGILVGIGLVLIGVLAILKFKINKDSK